MSSYRYFFEREQILNLFFSPTPRPIVLYLIRPCKDHHGSSQQHNNDTQGTFLIRVHIDLAMAVCQKLSYCICFGKCQKLGDFKVFIRKFSQERGKWTFLFVIIDYLFWNICQKPGYQRYNRFWKMSKTGWFQSFLSLNFLKMGEMSISFHLIDFSFFLSIRRRPTRTTASGRSTRRSLTRTS